MRSEYDGRQMSGRCICVNGFQHFKIGDLFMFEYKPDENNCWLYYLTNIDNGIVELCNWAFFDRHFEITHDNVKDEIIEFLLDMLEEEHMVMRAVAVKEVKDKFDIEL